MNLSRLVIVNVSDSQPLFEIAHAVAGDRELRLCLVLQPHQYPAVDGGKQLLHEPGVHDGGAVNAHEPPWIQTLLELGQSVVDHVLAAVDDGEGELVPGD